MQLEFFIAAQRAIIDERSNELTLVGVVEEFAAGAFPAQLPRFDLVACWNLDQGEKGEFEATLHYEAPGLPTPIAFPVRFQGGSRRARCLIQVHSLPVPEAGDVLIRIDCQGVSASHTIYARPPTEAELAALANASGT